MGSDFSISKNGCVEFPVSGLIETTGPPPTSCASVDPNVVEESLDDPAGKVRDDKMQGSHVSALSADARLGSLRCDQHRNDPLILPSIGLLYYSDCRGNDRVLQAVQDHLRRVVPADWPIVSVTLKPISFGRNVVLPLERGQLTLFRQILAGLEQLDTEIVFFAEHDVLYHASHFDFRPPPLDRVYYNAHRYQVSSEDGRAVHYRCCQTANLCADRQLLLAHYRKRIAAVEAAGGYRREMGYEPGTNRWSRRMDGIGHETWMAPYPNLDVRTRYNLSKTRWSPQAFRNKDSCEGWIEVDEIPGWGLTRGRFEAFLADLGRLSQSEGVA